MTFCHYLLDNAKHMTPGEWHSQITDYTRAPTHIFWKTLPGGEGVASSQGSSPFPSVFKEKALEQGCGDAPLVLTLSPFLSREPGNEADGGGLLL